MVPALGCVLHKAASNKLATTPGITEEQGQVVEKNARDAANQFRRRPNFSLGWPQSVSRVQRSLIRTRRFSNYLGLENKPLRWADVAIHS